MKQAVAALRFITACLGDQRQVDHVSDLRKEIVTGNPAWETLVWLANNHLLAPALWAALVKMNLADELPADLQDYLQELHRLNTHRNARLQAQLLEAVQQLNNAAIVPVLLKGAVHLVTDIYDDRGARMMTDLDLLIPPEYMDRALDALHVLGYRANAGDVVSFEDHRHCTPLFRPGDFGALEVHHQLVSDRIADTLPTSVALAQAKSVAFRGLSIKVLSPTHRVMLNILHSQIIDQHHARGVIPLRSLHEVAAETAAASVPLDWAAIAEPMVDRGWKRILTSYCYLAHRLFGAPLPHDIRVNAFDRLYYLRVCGQLRWQWLDVLAHRLQRSSRENMQRRYGCRDDWLSINHMRLLDAKKRLSNRLARSSNSHQSRKSGQQ